MSDPTRDALKQAYQLIKAGDKAAALNILRPICRAQPDNLPAWWLAANALTDPAQQRNALNRVLEIDPFHEQAHLLLARLDEAAAPKPQPAPKPVTTQNATHQGRRGAGLVLGGLLLVSLILGGVAFFAFRGAEESGETQISAPTVAPLPSDDAASVAAVAASPTDVLPSLTPAMGRALPPTWTPLPSLTPDTRPSPTSWIESYGTREPTLDPASFGETYWEGNGRDDFTMEVFRLRDGSYVRFYDFPIQVFLEGDAYSESWRQAALNAVIEISQVVPIELTTDSSNPDIVVEILSMEDFINLNRCPEMYDDEDDPNLVPIGCANAPAILPGKYSYPVGSVWINADHADEVREEVLLHELLHAMGVWVHSPYPTDIMYYVVVEGLTTLSPRDLNTLRRLYNTPASGQ